MKILNTTFTVIASSVKELGKSGVQKELKLLDAIDKAKAELKELQGQRQTRLSREKLQSALDKLGSGKPASASRGKKPSQASEELHVPKKGKGTALPGFKNMTKSDAAALGKHLAGLEKSNKHAAADVLHGLADNSHSHPMVHAVRSGGVEIHNEDNPENTKSWLENQGFSKTKSIKGATFFKHKDGSEVRVSKLGKGSAISVLQ